jgi:hypothetical protein
VNLTQHERAQLGQVVRRQAEGALSTEQDALRREQLAELRRFSTRVESASDEDARNIIQSTTEGQEMFLGLARGMLGILVQWSTSGLVPTLVTGGTVQLLQDVVGGLAAQEVMGGMGFVEALEPDGRGLFIGYDKRAEKIFSSLKWTGITPQVGATVEVVDTCSYIRGAPCELNPKWDTARLFFPREGVSGTTETATSGPTNTPAIPKAGARSGVTPSPTVPTGATATPSKPTPTVVPSAPIVSPTPQQPTQTPAVEPTPVSTKTIVIKLLTKPYRFDPSWIELEGGKWYTFEFIGSEENEGFVIIEAEIEVGVAIPAYGKASLTFFIPSKEKIYMFYSDVHHQSGNIVVK